MLSDTNIRTKKALLRTITAFAYKNFLPNNEEEKYLIFIVRLCCSSQTLGKGAPDLQDHLDLQRTADNTLYMLSTSIIPLQDVLWNMLLKCFLSNEYADASIILLRCLSNLASHKSAAGTYELAFVHCLALLGQPIPDFRGTFVLSFLRNIRVSESEKIR